MITVKDLINKLQELDPNLPIGVLHDNGVMSTNELGVYEGEFLNGDGPKMVFKREKRKFVAIGNPGDYDEIHAWSVCKPIEIHNLFEKHWEKEEL